MSEPRFTPGPWQTQGWVQTWAYIPVHDARHNVVCAMYPDSVHGYSRDEVDANAKLIAAAPDLYAALSAILADSVSADPDMTQMKLALAAGDAALAKARGEQP